MNTKLVLFPVIIIPVIVVIFFVPLIDEFETFNCITTPCIMPKITIFESFQTGLNEIKNFEECIAAGNPAMESHPRQCRTSDGKHFVEKIDLDI